MSDNFTAWKLMQDHMLAAQKAQLDAATKLIGMTEHFSGALEAAQKVAASNAKAWESWMAMWGGKK